MNRQEIALQQSMARLRSFDAELEQMMQRQRQRRAQKKLNGEDTGGLLGSDLASQLSRIFGIGGGGGTAAPPQVGQSQVGQQQGPGLRKQIMNFFGL